MDHSGVAIQHMKLSGAIHHREALLQSLEAQSWPAEDDEKLIVIRRIDVCGPWWQLGSDAVAIARQMTASAVHISQPGAQTAEVIYFRHRAEQIIYFCRDLLRNTCQHWYWQTFLKPASAPAAILRNLFQENVFDLPDILFHLNHAHCFPVLIKTLGVDNVREVYRNLCRITQWNSCPASESYHNLLPQAYFSLAAKRIIAEWTGPVAVLKREALDDDAIVSLIALLCAWKICPHKLADGEFSASWESRVRDAIYDNTEAVDEFYGAQSNFQSDNDRRDTISSNKREGYAINSDSSADMNAANQSQRALPREDRYPSTFTIDKSEETISTDTQIYLTQYGGIFFLINALLITKCTEDIQESRVAPWLIIQRMARMFGCDADSGLIEFLESQTTTAEEEGALLSASKLAEKLIPQVRHRFHQHLPLNSDFFLLRARIEQRLPYINIYFHVSSIQLPLRMLGLDINLGWQPWLGQVIKYHYVTDPDLLPSNPSRDQNP